MEQKKITEKTINKYKIQFKTRFNKSNDENIFLDIEVSKELQDVLRDCSVLDELCDFEFSDGESNLMMKRYKVRRWVYSLFTESEKEILFLKKLIDTGKVSLKILVASRIDSIILHLKHNLRDLIQEGVKYNKLNMVVSFNVDKTDNSD